MNISAIREQATASPFMPFIIHMSNGRTYPVRHPDWIFTGPAEVRLSVVTVVLESGNLLMIDAAGIESLTAAPELARAGT